jgi:ADP-ribosylglycohydrolase
MMRVRSRRRAESSYGFDNAACLSIGSTYTCQYPVDQFNDPEGVSFGGARRQASPSPCRNKATMVTLTADQYRERVYGGWTGKLLGRAAGAPADGQRQPPEVGEYPDALSLPEVDACEGVSIQRVWLTEILHRGPGLSGEDLARAWMARVDCSAAEYGHACANLRRELLPPLSGVYDNPFRESLGAMARADLWGLVAPGDPGLAAQYALQDASLDHAGAGVAGAVFVAALVSAAFVEADAARLIGATLGLVPKESRVARAVRDVARWHGEFAHWRRTREMLLRAYGSEDVRDSAIASGLLALVLLDGDGDFGRALTVGARCGWSAAFVCGAAGAVIGAAVGLDGLPAAWREAGGAVVEERLGPLANLTCQAGEEVIAAAPGGQVVLSEQPAAEEPRLPQPDPGPVLRAAAMGPYVISLRRGPLEVLVDYETRPTIGYDSPRRLSVRIANRGERSIELRTRVSAPDGFVALTNAEPLTLPEEGDVSFSVSITAPHGNCHLQPVNVCRLLVSVEEQPEIPIPIILVGESQWYAAGPYPSFDEAFEPERPESLAGAAPLGPAEPWRLLSVSEPAVSLLAGLEGDQGTYYLATDLLIAPGADSAGPMAGEALPRRPGVLRLASNDGVAVWLNGALVLSHHAHRPADPRVGADECAVSFASGWNRLVIKMAQCSPRRFLAISLRDPAGPLLLPAAAGRNGA